MIINFLQGNDCEPVTVKKIEDNFAKHAVYVDHDCGPGKHKRDATQMETGIKSPFHERFS